MKHRVIIFALFMFAVTAINAQTVNNVEYFLDGDPGYGLTQRITNIRIGENSLTFDISEAEAGAHVLYARVQDSQGRWSTTMSRPIYIERNPDIVRVEYFFDDNDPGKGKAHAMAIPNVRYKGRLDFTTQLDITGLALGEHTLTVRAVNRFDKWTNVLTRKFTIVEGGVDPVTPDPPTTTGDLSRIEYFFDTDPGYGKGIALENPQTGTNTYTMSFENLQHGAHVLYLRAQDTNGLWSSVIARPIYVSPLSSQEITAVEYFFDNNDPGEGKASAVELPANLAKELSFAFEVNISGLSKGEHQFNLRARDNHGVWSLLESRPFRINDLSGVDAVEWTWQLGISMQTGYCKVEAIGNANRGDCLVEVLSANGMTLAKDIWKQSASEISIPTRIKRGQIVIVKVTETTTSRTFVRRCLIDK